MVATLLSIFGLTFVQMYRSDSSCYEDVPTLDLRPTLLRTRHFSSPCRDPAAISSEPTSPLGTPDTYPLLPPPFSVHYSRYNELPDARFQMFPFVVITVTMNMSLPLRSYFFSPCGARTLQSTYFHHPPHPLPTILCIFRAAHRQLDFGRSQS